MKFICHRVCSGKAYDVNPLNAPNACETFASVTNCVCVCVCEWETSAQVCVCISVCMSRLVVCSVFFLSLPFSVVSDKRKRSIIVSYQIRLPAASEVSRARPARGRARRNEQKKKQFLNITRAAKSSRRETIKKCAYFCVRRIKLG